MDGVEPSWHVIAVITKTLMYYDAATLLRRMALDPGNVIIGQGTVIEDPDVLYLMHYEGHSSTIRII